jgi:hypothetical protein
MDGMQFGTELGAGIGGFLISLALIEKYLIGGLILLGAVLVLKAVKAVRS